MRAHSKGGGPLFHCGMCNDFFTRKGDLQQHMLNHAEIKKEWVCEKCHFPFDDQVELERHHRQTGHGDVAGAAKALPYLCDCPKKCPFDTAAELSIHKKFSCEKHSDHLRQKKAHKEKDYDIPVRMELPNYEPPSKALPPVAKPATVQSFRASPAPAGSSDDDHFCDICMRSFRTESRYENHWLSCAPAPSSSSQEPQLANGNSSASKLRLLPHSSQGTVNNENSSPLAPRPIIEPTSLSSSLAETSRPTLPVQESVRVLPPTESSHNGTAQGSSAPKTPKDTLPSKYQCNQCDRVFRSDPGRKVHLADVHSIGGPSLALHGKHAFMLTQRARENLKQLGLLRGAGPPPGSSSRRSRRGALNAPSSAAGRSPHGQQNSGQGRPHTSNQHPGPPPSFVPTPPGRMPTGTSVGGVEEMIQANDICGKIMRLGLQSDVHIRHSGTITCAGIDWTRIGVVKQANVGSMFDELCHLPKVLQAQEYLPPPKTFKDDYQSQYPVGDFKYSPDRSSAKPGLVAIAISCIKILMSDGREEVVKVAAVDVVTGRVLMNNLVCTDPTASVKNWRTNITGLAGYQDLEVARQNGYKIFKGWQAARSGLWKFIDKQTIVVGHNLRADLDCLRMIHGRAVDTAKMIEKGANGPLSKAQLSLDVLCRDLPKVRMSTHRIFGRDALQNAFAARELALWKIKNPDMWSKWARDKSLEYQRVSPAARV